MRIDKLLWFLRLASSRSFAQEWVAQGHIRLNGRRIERSSAETKIGDILVLPIHQGVRVMRILALPERRGPAIEAQACYEVLDEQHLSTLAGVPFISASKGVLQP